MATVMKPAVCVRCGADFLRPTGRGIRRYCDDCRIVVNRAHYLVSAHLKRGHLKRGPCEKWAVSECRGKIEAHHDDYGRPLDVRWLCQRHHMGEHVPYWDRHMPPSLQQEGDA